MTKEKLGIDYAHALDLYFFEEYDSSVKHKAIRNTAEKWGIPYDDLRKWRHLENCNCLVDVEIKAKIKNLCKDYWPSQAQINELTEEYLSEEEQHKLWQEKERIMRETKRKNKIQENRITLLEKKYNLPIFQGKFPRSIRYNQIIELSKSLSMHLPELIQKYPQCKEIVFNPDKAFWINNKQSLADLAKIPNEALNYNNKFEVFSKNDQQLTAPGCSTALVLLGIIIFYCLG